MQIALLNAVVICIKIRILTPELNNFKKMEQKQTHISLCDRTNFFWITFLRFRSENIVRKGFWTGLNFLTTAPLN